MTTETDKAKKDDSKHDDDDDDCHESCSIASLSAPRSATEKQKSQHGKRPSRAQKALTLPYETVDPAAFRAMTSDHQKTRVMLDPVTLAPFMITEDGKLRLYSNDTMPSEPGSREL